MSLLNPPEVVLEIASTLEQAGYETWCVGGAIRDALLGHPDLDWDLATSATPQQMRELFGGKRTIPIGVEFGTVGVLDRAGKMHEVTTFRRDVKTDGRHAEVEFGVSLDDDLARRDFTINAIAYSPKHDDLRDPFGGRADLEAKIVRAVGDPEARMREDRLRALRAIRFAARFGFAIEPSTRRAIENSAAHLGRLSPERVKQELDKTMEQVVRPSIALKTWRSTGAFATLVPALASASDVALEVSDFLAMPGPKNRPARRALRFAGLLSSLESKEAAKVMIGLRSSKVEIQLVEAMVGRWRKLGATLADALLADKTPSDADVRRWVAAIGRLQVGSFMRLADAAWAADRAHGQSAPSERAIHALYRRMARSAWNDAIDLGSLAVDGDDLRSAGIPAGPALGRVLNELLEAVIEDPSQNTRDRLLRRAMGSGQRA